MGDKAATGNGTRRRMRTSTQKTAVRTGWIGVQRDSPPLLVYKMHHGTHPELRVPATQLVLGGIGIHPLRRPIYRHPAITQGAGTSLWAQFNVDY